MKPLFARMGGKTRLKKKIIEMMPNENQYDTYVEPFFGAGSVFFALPHDFQSKKEVINDLDPVPISILEGFKKYNGNKIRDDVNGEYTKQDFQKIKNSNPSTDYFKFIRDFILTRTSYYGKGIAYSLGKTSKIKINPQDRYQQRLKNVVILNEDYKKVVDKYDSPRTFIFLDPPYEISNNNHYNFPQLDIYDLLDFINTKKSMVLITYNYNPDVEKYSEKLGFNTQQVLTKYVNPLQGGANLRTIKELVIKNY